MSPKTTGVTLTERAWPVRTCVACRRRFPANELLRVVRTDDGPRVDVRRALEGRGCHVCPTLSCVERATGGDGKSLRRALRCGSTDNMSSVTQALTKVIAAGTEVATRPEAEHHRPQVANKDEEHA